MPIWAESLLGFADSRVTGAWRGAVSEAEAASLWLPRTGGCAEDEGKGVRRLRLSAARSGEEARARRDVRDAAGCEGRRRVVVDKIFGSDSGHTSTHEGVTVRVKHGHASNS